MCYGCRNITEEDTNKLFTQYNIDVNEYIAFSNTVLGDLTDLKPINLEATTPSNTLK